MNERGRDHDIRLKWREIKINFHIILNMPSDFLKMLSVCWNNAKDNELVNWVSSIALDLTRRLPLTLVIIIRKADSP